MEYLDKSSAKSIEWISVSEISEKANTGIAGRQVPGVEHPIVRALRRLSSDFHRGINVFSMESTAIARFSRNFDSSDYAQQRTGNSCKSGDGERVRLRIKLRVQGRAILTN